MKKIIKIEISDPELQQISTINSRIMIDYVRTVLGESYLEVLFYGILIKPVNQYYYLGKPLDMMFFESGNGWIPNEISLKLFDNLHDMGVATFDVGKHSIYHSDKLNNIAIQSLLHLMGPVKSIRKVGNINRMFNRTKEVELIDLKQTEAKIKLVYKAGIKHTNLVTEFNMGIYVGLLKQIGYDDVQAICEEDNFTAERPFTLLTFNWSGKTLWYRFKWIVGLYLTRFVAKEYMQSHHGINKYHNNLINDFHSEIRNKEKALKDKDHLFQILEKERAQTEEILEKKIAEKTKAMKEKQQQLSTEIKLKDEQFVHISHELKTPVMLVKSPLTEVLNGEYLSTNQTESIQFAIDNIERLETLLYKITQIEKIKATDKIIKCWIWLAGEVQNNTQSLIYQAMKEKQINIDINCPKTLWVEFNAEYLSLIISNILGNAIKFSPKQSQIKFQIKQKKNNEISLICSDNGPGIQAHEIEHIFTKHYRSEKTKAIDGSGLGLYIVKQLIDKVDGHINVISEPDKQTTFKIDLPLRLKYKDNRVKYSTQVFENKTNTIVIVEDDPVLRTYLVNILSNDANCIEAENGIEGLEKVIYHRPELIITDLKMPYLSGEKFVQAVRDNPFTNKTPVIILTGLNGSELDDKLMSQITDYIEKPINSDALKNKIRNQLQLITKVEQKNLFVLDAITEINQKLNPEEIEWLNCINEFLIKYHNDAEFRAVNLAKKLNLTPKTLQRKLSHLVSCTPHNLIKNTRLYFARQMLTQTKQPIGKIAFSCGFRTESAFTNAFKKEYKQSPSDFLKNSKVGIGITG